MLCCVTINSLPNERNKSYNNLIESGKLKKVGFLMQRLMKLEKYESAYWVKNPSISCFNSEFEIYPPIGVTNQKEEQIFGTSAYFHFEKGVLKIISFQLIKNKFLAKNGIKLFRSICGKYYGIPKAYDYLDDFAKFAEWEDNDSKLITELSDCGNHLFVHWVLI